MTRTIVDRLRVDLQRDAPSGLVGMLVDQVLVCLLALEVMELAYLDGCEREHTQRQAAFWIQRMEGCQKRMHAAVRNLALARKTEGPDIWRALPSGRVLGEPVG